MNWRGPQAPPSVVVIVACQECRHFDSRRRKDMHPTRTIDEGYCGHDALLDAGEDAMGLDAGEQIEPPAWCPLRFDGRKGPG
jgi:hypothetical protein